MARAGTADLLMPSASGSLKEKWRSPIETRVGQPLRQFPVRFAPQPITRSGLNPSGRALRSKELSAQFAGEVFAHNPAERSRELTIAMSTLLYRKVIGSHGTRQPSPATAAVADADRRGHWYR